MTKQRQTITVLSLTDPQPRPGYRRLDVYPSLRPLPPPPPSSWIMQTATLLQSPLLPPMLSSYNRQPMNGVQTSNVLPTPPVASRKRKRAHQYTVSYSEVQEVDREGITREVIVIEDTPPPSTASPATSRTHAYSTSYQPPVYSAPVRTRARAAAEAQGNLSGSTSTAILPPPPKKRKREVVDETPRAKKPITNGVPASAPSKQWVSTNGAVSKDVRTHRPSTSSFNLVSPARIFFHPSLPTTTPLAMTRRDTT